MPIDAEGMRGDAVADRVSDGVQLVPAAGGCEDEPGGDQRQQDEQHNTDEDDSSTRRHGSHYTGARLALQVIGRLLEIE